MNEQTIKDIKIFVVVGLVCVIVLLLGAVFGLKRQLRMQNYAIANDCTWTWNGSYYGDDRDYVCK